MNMLILTTIEQGLIFSVLALGVFITYKILDIPDLSVEGTFPFGAFIFIKFLQMGMHPILATLMAFVFGAFAGLLTATLFIKLKIQPILAGILTMTILYSVNLKVAGLPNISIFNEHLIFDLGPKIVILILIVLIVKILLDLFLKTQVGYLLVATGDNEHLTRSLGKNSDRYKTLGFMLANGLIAVSGALMAQYNGYADITMGSSIIVIALASIIIGDTIFKKNNKLKNTTRAIIGALIYQAIGTIAIDLGLNPDDLNLVNAGIVIFFIAYNNVLPDLFNKNKKNEVSSRA